MSGVVDADARILRAIVEGVEAATGEEFFRSLVPAPGAGCSYAALRPLSGRNAFRRRTLCS
jgi:hypothetical protein